MLALLAGVSIYALLIAYVYAFQSKLIYFPNIPGRALTATPSAIGPGFEDVRLTTADRAELHGWYVPAAAGASAVLFCHGNAGNVSHRLEWLQLRDDMGLAVLLFDYRGYGQSSGAPNEQGTYLDAHAAWHYLRNRRGLSSGSIVIAGESLGGAVAANLAKDVTPAALILVSTFTSAPDLASDLYWYLPVRLLARFRYGTAEYVAHVRAPTLVIHSRADEIVPFSHAEEILRRASEPKQLVEILGDHNAGPSMNGCRLTEGIHGFLNAHRVLYE